MRKLVLLIIVLLVALLGGSYIYASSVQEKVALKSNLKELTTLENVSSYNETIKTEAVMTLSVAGQEQVIPSSEEIKISVDVEEDLALVETIDGEEELTIKEYKAQFSPINDYNVWEKVINDGDFETKEVTFDGEDAWEFTINHESITKDYLETLENSFTTQMQATFAAQGMTVSDVAVEFNGDLEFVIIIDKSDFQLRNAVVTASDDINLSVTASMGDQAVPISVAVSDLVVDFSVNDYELKGILNSLPINPLTLWVASAM